MIDVILKTGGIGHWLGVGRISHCLIVLHQLGRLDRGGLNGMRSWLMSPVVRIVNHRRCFGRLDDLPARRPGDQVFFIILLVHLILFYTKTSPTANIRGVRYVWCAGRARPINTALLSAMVC